MLDNERAREYYKANKEEIISRIKSNVKEKSSELGFNRTSFHDKAKRFARKYRLKPKVCSVCGGEGRIELHHPSYESFDKRCEVVFCCKSCHIQIHNGKIREYSIVNLLECRCH